MSNASTNNRGNSVSGAKSIFFFDAALLIELAASPSNHIIRFQAPIAYILDSLCFHAFKVCLQLSLIITETRMVTSPKVFRVLLLTKY